MKADLPSQSLWGPPPALKGRASTLTTYQERGNFPTPPVPRRLIGDAKFETSFDFFDNGMKDQRQFKEACEKPGLLPRVSVLAQVLLPVCCYSVVLVWCRMKCIT